MSFNRENRFGGRGNRNFSRSGQMFEAICSECGKDCEVPFRPTGDKPVFCSECFRKEDRGGRESQSRRDGRKFGQFNEKRMFSATCSNCGKKCEVPFRPTGEKPVYCNDCFSSKKNETAKSEYKASGNEGRSMVQTVGTAHFDEQFKILGVKLDAILKAIAPSAVIEEKTKEVKVPSAEILKNESKKPVKKTGKKSVLKKKKA